MKNHIMLDLETLGVHNDSVILSIAAIQFDINTGDLGKQFYKTITIESSLHAKRKIEADTLLWWLQQGADIRSEALKGEHRLSDVLMDFILYFHDVQDSCDHQEAVCIWGNSASFDCGMLASSFEANGMEKPWSHRYERCYRTLIGSFPTIGKDIPRVSAHDPRADCEYQIERLCKVWSHINHNVATSYQDTQFVEDYETSILLLKEAIEEISRYENAGGDAVVRKVREWMDGIKPLPNERNS
jgi:hypothetical protein